MGGTVQLRAGEIFQQHRNAYVSMQACSQHIPYQLPNEHSRVGFLLDGIENDDAGLQVALANVEDDTAEKGKETILSVLPPTYYQRIPWQRG